MDGLVQKALPKLILALLCSLPLSSLLVIYVWAMLAH
jgi:hypothetical protein